MRKQEHTFFPPDSPLPASERTIGGTRYSYFGLPLVPAQAGRLRMDSVSVKPRRTALFQSTSYMFRWQDRANSPEICICGRPAHKILLPRYNLACLKIAYLYCFAWFTMEYRYGATSLCCNTRSNSSSLKEYHAAERNRALRLSRCPLDSAGRRGPYSIRQARAKAWPSLSCMPRNLRDEFLNKSFELRICCMPVHGTHVFVL